MSSEGVKVRIFQNPVLEALSHSNAVVNSVVWYGFGFFCLYHALGLIMARPLYALAIAVVTYIGWTLTEYVAHRFLFHYNATSDFGKKVFYIMHIHHHDYPDEMDRNMLPLSITIPVGSGIIIAALTLLDQPTAALFLGVYAIAYINYDLLHYMTHRPWAPVPLAWKRHHMLHHYRTDDANYGVQTAIWDRLFGTYRK